MTRKFIDFEAVESLASIEQLAQMLNLDAKRSGRQLRCACPVHGGDERALAITPDVRSRRGSLGVFFCQSAKEGGDRIALVAHCMEIGQQDAAFFIQDQFGTGTDESTVQHSTVSKERATVPPEQRREPTRPPQKDAAFDPAAFAAKLEYTAEVRALGFDEATAQAFGIGFYRGKVYLPVRYPTGEISGFIGYSDGQMKLPPKWLPQTTNVVALRRA